MTVFRWIFGVLIAVLASGTVLAFVLFLIGGTDLWLQRARNWRRLTTAMAMFWFNFEIWRRVVLIIIHW